MHNQIAKIQDRETKQNTTAYTDILAGLKFEKDFIRQFLSEEVMQDSVTYQDILHKGEQKGDFLKISFLISDSRFLIKCTLTNYMMSIFIVGCVTIV